MNNQRTVTIKMTRAEALRVCRLITDFAFTLEHDDSKTCDCAVEEWRNIRDKMRVGIDKLDKEV